MTRRRATRRPPSIYAASERNPTPGPGHHVRRPLVADDAARDARGDADDDATSVAGDARTRAATGRHADDRAPRGRRSIYAAASRNPTPGPGARAAARSRRAARAAAAAAAAARRPRQHLPRAARRTYPSGSTVPCRPRGRAPTAGGEALRRRAALRAAQQHLQGAAADRGGGGNPGPGCDLRADRWRRRRRGRAHDAAPRPGRVGGVASGARAAAATMRTRAAAGRARDDTPARRGGGCRSQAEAAGRGDDGRRARVAGERGPVVGVLDRPPPSTPTEQTSGVLAAAESDVDELFRGVDPQ